MRRCVSSNPFSVTEMRFPCHQFRHRVGVYPPGVVATDPQYTTSTGAQNT
jgi:hypothetical protein